MHVCCAQPLCVACCVVTTLLDDSIGKRRIEHTQRKRVDCKHILYLPALHQLKVTHVVCGFRPQHCEPKDILSVCLGAVQSLLCGSAKPLALARNV